VSVPSGSHASLHDDWREPKVDAGSAAIVIASCPRPRWPTGAHPCSPTVSATRAATAPQPRAPRQAAEGPPRSRGGRCDHEDRAVHGSWLGILRGRSRRAAVRWSRAAGRQASHRVV